MLDLPWATACERVQRCDAVRQVGRVTGLVGMKEQAAVSQTVRNDFSEASAGGRIVSAYEVAEDLKVLAEGL